MLPSQSCLHSAMRHATLFILACLIFAASWEVLPCVAFTSEEVASLTEILNYFPLLSDIPWKLAKSREPYLGKPWRQQSIQSACDGGEGWSLFGIHCNADKHVDAIYLYVSTAAAQSPYYTPTNPIYRINSSTSQYGLVRAYCKLTF